MTAGCFGSVNRQLYHAHTHTLTHTHIRTHTHIPTEALFRLCNKINSSRVYANFLRSNVRVFTHAAVYASADAAL